MWSPLSRSFLALTVLTACGPALQQRPVTSRTFLAGPGATCGQELAAARFVAKGAKWGESVRIQACGLGAFGGHVDISAALREGGTVVSSATFGSEDEPSGSRCGGAVAEPAQSGGAGAAGRPPAPSGPGSAGVGSGAAAAPAPAALSEVQDTDEVCPRQSLTLSLGALRPGSIIQVRLWSRSPRDLTGAAVRLTHAIEEPNVSDEEWKKHLAKEDAEALQRLARMGGLPVARHPVPRRLDEPSRPPPPPQAETRPPSPSPHSEWVPGYWHWSQDWHWVAGRWQVPPVDGGVLVSAPHAPPAPRGETGGVGPPGLVWLPGYWAWDGKAYVWASGGWGRPPHAGAGWRAPGWRPQGSRVVFVPGAWAVP